MQMELFALLPEILIASFSEEFFSLFNTIHTYNE